MTNHFNSCIYRDMEIIRNCIQIFTGATLATFGEGNGLSHCFSCSATENMVVNCTPTENTNATDIGVTCMSHDEAVTDVCQYCSTPNPNMHTNSPIQCPPCVCVAPTVTVMKSSPTQHQPSTYVATTNRTESLTANQNANSGSRVDDNIVTFQVITGILLVLLIAVTVDGY